MLETTILQTSVSLKSVANISVLKRGMFSATTNKTTIKQKQQNDNKCGNKHLNNQVKNGLNR